jgi:hypothetical protein
MPGLGLRTLTLLGLAAVCLALGTVAVYARTAIVDEHAFGERATVALGSDEVRQEVADRLSDHLLRQSPALVRWRPVIEDQANLLAKEPGFAVTFANAARAMQETLFSNRDALASFDVGPAGNALKARLAEREPRLAKPLAGLESGDLMDLSGDGIERTLRRVAPLGGELARLGIPALVLALLLLATAVAGSAQRRRALHAAALTVGVTGAALAAGWTGARAGTLDRFDTSRGDSVVGAIWNAYLGDLRVWCLALGAVGLIAAACVAATLPAGELGRPLAALRRRLAAEHLRAPLALGGLLVAALVLLAPDVVTGLAAVALAAGLLYRAVHDLARLALR